MDFFANKHVRYFLRFVLQNLPSQASGHDSQRVVLCFFALSGLDLLGALDQLSEDRKKSICDWVYHLQVLPTDSDNDNTPARWGFQASSTIIGKADTPIIDIDHSEAYICSHVGMTYTGLINLIILGDDLSRIDRKSIAQGVRACQQFDGSFCATLAGSECDMRFVYCAAAICYMIQDWSGMDTSLTTEYIVKSLSYDGAFAQGPGLESHGGHTFCAVASLSLMGTLKDALSKEQVDRLKRWLLMRQETGFQGRPNKPEDTCYSFWVGATLEILGCYDLVDKEQIRSYTLATQNYITGGFSKWTSTDVDPLHSYFAVAGLSVMKEPGLLSVHPELNFSQRGVEHLHKLHKCWGCK